MAMIVSHKLRRAFFKINDDDIFIIKKNDYYTVYNVRIHVNARKMFRDNIIEVAAEVSGDTQWQNFKYKRKLSFDVTKAFPNNMNFDDTQSSFVHNSDSTRLVGVDRVFVSKQLKNKVRDNIDPISAAITSAVPSSYNKITGISSLNNSEFIYDVEQDDTTHTKRKIKKRLKTLNVQFIVPIWFNVETLNFTLSETGKNGMPRSYVEGDIDCRKKLLKFLAPNTIPTVSGSQAPGYHVLNISHPDKKIKKLKILSKDALSGRFKKVGVFNASNSASTIIKLPASLPTIYRVQGHGLDVIYENTSYSSCAVGNFEKINMKKHPIITSNQKDDYINVKFIFDNVDIVYAELVRKNMASNVEEIVARNVESLSSFMDTTVVHRQTYAYHLVYFSKGGLRYESNKTKLVEYVYPSEKFSMTSDVAVDENGIATITLTPASEKSDASILYSSFFNDSPSMTDSDLESLINNYDYILLSQVTRTNTNTGAEKILGFFGDINENGKIIIKDRLRESGNYEYTSKLFARPIRQIVADISATSKFTFQNKGKFSDFISDAHLNVDFDLNFNEKFLNQYSIFDSTLVYGRSMAEHFEKIIEHGKTGVVNNTNIYFEEKSNPVITNEKIIEIKNRPVLSFNTMGIRDLDCFLVKVQTIDKMYFISALSPAYRINFTDNITRESTGNVLYSIVPVKKDMEVLPETYIGSFYFGEENSVDKTKYHYMQGI